MADKTECEIYLAIDEDGNWEVANDPGEAFACLNSSGACVRTVKIIARITPPVLLETEIDIPDEAGETTKVEAAAS